MLFDDSDSSLNSNDNSFFSNSSETPSTQNVKKSSLSNQKKTDRHIVNHFFVPLKRNETFLLKSKIKQDLENKTPTLISLDELKTENSLKMSNRNNSKSVHFTSPLAVQSSPSNSPSLVKLPATPKPSVVESNFLRPSLSKTKYANLTPLTKTDIIRSSSFRYGNNSNLKSYFMANQSSITSKTEETKSLDNMKETEINSKDDFGNSNTHTKSRLIRMASNWNIKSRSSSTSSNYLDPNLVSQNKIKQTQMFLSDENEYANTESALSRQLAEYTDKINKINLLDDHGIETIYRKGKQIKSPTLFMPMSFDTSSQRSSTLDSNEVDILPKVETNFISCSRRFNKNIFTRSFRLVSIDRNNFKNNKYVNNNNDIKSNEQNIGLNKKSQLPIQIN
ncbi:unnamed protein product [Brachionus calyciflorus]|uniref:Uncharacterized protein n=1 Tax=Brachionus calyciflorus TaxID=104777 RepID=A0A813T6W6_9BILA|nr:unnamed protein product [Brachionus calyciflorus]